jgi:hypothetical protein
VSLLKPVSKLSIVNTLAPIELEKRTFIPVVLSSKCPHCGTDVSNDLADGETYLSYPKVNRPITFTFWHECPDGEDTEWQYNIIIRMTVTEEL